MTKRELEKEVGRLRKIIKKNDVTIRVADSEIYGLRMQNADMMKELEKAKKTAILNYESAKHHLRVSEFLLDALESRKPGEVKTFNIDISGTSAHQVLRGEASTPASKYKP